MHQMDSVHWPLAQQCQISILWRLIVVSAPCAIYAFPSSPFFSTWTSKWKWWVYYWINVTPWIAEDFQDIWATCRISWSVPQNSGGLWRHVFSLHSITYKTSTSYPRYILDQTCQILFPTGFFNITCDYLMKRFLGIHAPILVYLHVSLANQEHIRAYIKQAVQTFYPHGTG